MHSDAYAILSRIFYHTFFFCLSLSPHKDSKKHLSIAWKEVNNDMLSRKKCSPRGDSFFSETLKPNLYWILAHSFISLPFFFFPPLPKIAHADMELYNVLYSCTVWHLFLKTGEILFLMLACRSQFSRWLLRKNLFCFIGLWVLELHISLQFVSPHTYEFIIEDASLLLTHNQAG